MYPSIFHEWYEEVWNHNRPEAVYRLAAEDCVFHHLDESGRDAHGPDEFMAFFKRFRGAFPDTHIVTHETVENGGLIAGRWTATGTHLGDELGMPATGNAIRIEGMGFARVKDGKLVECWNSWDTLALVQQLEANASSARAGSR